MVKSFKIKLSPSEKDDESILSQNDDSVEDNYSPDINLDENIQFNLTAYQRETHCMNLPSIN
jgi:hypothetical protein